MDEEVQDKYEFVCLGCNSQLGTSKDQHSSPPTQCPKCNGVRIATREIKRMDEPLPTEFDVVIFNKRTGVNKKGGFVLSPEEQKIVDGSELRKVFARKVAEIFSQVLNEQNSFELARKEVIK